MKIFVYPGSFDPVTKGHLDIIERASKICDKLIVAVLVNRSKKPIFTVDERVQMIKNTIGDRENIEVDSFSGMLVDYMHRKDAKTIIKGLRAISDYEYELQMELVNKTIDENIETLFLMSDLKYSFLSSSIVREVATHGGKIDDYVPGNIVDMIVKRIGPK